MRRSVVLTGLSGAGKSTVGPLLAARFGCEFFDLDREIERRSDRTIPQIFAEEGEGAFRALEAANLRRILLNKQPKVVAVGAGALVDDRLRQYALRNADVVWLQVPVDVAAKRCAQSEHRPLLDGDAATKLRKQLKVRAALYAEAPTAIDTAKRSPDAVARTLAEALCGHRTLRVSLSTTAYDVRLSTGGVLGVADAATSLGARRAIVISDTNVARLYGATTLEGLRAAGIAAELVTFPSG